MATPTPAPDTRLQVKRLFTAPREKVFQAWTDPERLTQWFLRTVPQQITKIHELQLRPGGSYKAEVTSPDGVKTYVLHGTYREIRPPEKLVFTWAWEHQPSFGETLVTVEFQARGTFTEVILTHELFPDAKARDDHNKGWIGCFDALAKIL